MELTGRVRQKYDLSSVWASKNTVLLAGEIGIESDTLKMKVGDGTTAWNSLPYISPTKLSDLTDDIGAGTGVDLSGYLLKSGGAMSGNLTYSNTTNQASCNIFNLTDSKIAVGWVSAASIEGGARLVLGGPTSQGNEGAFEIIANDGLASQSLKGTSTGNLTWNNELLATQAYVLDNYLPKSGGTLTGAIRFRPSSSASSHTGGYLSTSDYGIKLQAEDNNESSGGAYLRLHSTTLNGTSIDGRFVLTASGGVFSAVSQLIGTPSGSLTWNGLTLATNTYVANNYLNKAGDSLTGTITSSVANIVKRNVNNDILAIYGGTSISDGARFELYGGTRSINPGSFLLTASTDSSNYRQLLGKPDGFMSWAGGEICITGQNNYHLGDTSYGTEQHGAFHMTDTRYNLANIPSDTNYWNRVLGVTDSAGHRWGLIENFILKSGVFGFALSTSVDSTLTSNYSLQLRSDGELAWNGDIFNLRGGINLQGAIWRTYSGLTKGTKPSATTWHFDIGSLDSAGRNTANRLGEVRGFVDSNGSSGMQVVAYDFTSGSTASNEFRVLKLLDGNRRTDINSGNWRFEGNMLYRSDGDTNWLRISGGNGDNKGGSLLLYGQTASGNNAGRLVLRAYNGTDAISFDMYPELKHSVYNSTLVLSKNTDLSGTADNGPALVIGGTRTQAHIEIDANEIQAKASGTTVTNLIINSDGGNVSVGNTTGGARADVSAKAFHPNTTKTITLGTSSYLWKQLFANTTTISTSDARQKQQIVEMPEELLDAWSSIAWKRYKMNDSVEEKGSEAARYHTGVIAQEVDEVFKQAELDPRGYGFFCHDQWDAKPAVMKGDKVIESALEAGDAYAIRYEEALCIEAAYLRREISRLKSRIEQLERSNI